MSANDDSNLPEFGKPMLSQFCFDKDYVNLNHGSYGSLPKPVLEFVEKLGRECEGNPDKFMRRTYLPLLVDVRKRVAALINAETDECVIVPNTSHGVNTVLMNIDWQEGDIIIRSSTTYGSVSRAAQFLGDRPNIHPEIHTWTTNFGSPVTPGELVSSFRTFLHQLPHREGRQKIALIDGIISNPGILLPWADLVKVCREEGVISIVDAAHCIGQEVGIDLKRVDPDFWVSNCHKWLYSKRGSAVLYVPKRNQHLIKSSFPTSHDYVSPTDPPGSLACDFVGQFVWTGTSDLVTYLSVAAALDFRQGLGGEKRINAYCHDLAVKGGKRLADLLGTRVMDITPESSLVANMTNVLLPLSGEANDPERRSVMQRTIGRALFDEWNTFCAFYFHDGNWWCRCSAQIFNDISDFEYLGKALKAICGSIMSKDGNPTV